VTILRAADGEVVAQPEVPGSPHDADFTPDGDRLWVAVEKGQRLVKLSVPEGKKLHERRATAGPHDLAVSPDGDELWVTLGRVPTVEVRSADEGR
jgi:DNA-binding beta-propeller fold protein YncE